MHKKNWVYDAPQGIHCDHRIDANQNREREKKRDITLLMIIDFPYFIVGKNSTCVKWYKYTMDDARYKDSCHKINDRSTLYYGARNRHTVMKQYMSSARFVLLKYVLVLFGNSHDIRWLRDFLVSVTCSQLHICIEFDTMWFHRTISPLIRCFSHSILFVIVRASNSWLFFRVCLRWKTK